MDSCSFLVSFTAFSCWFTSVLGRTVDLSDGEFFEVPHAQITSNTSTIEELLLDHNLLTELGDGEFSGYQNLHILNLMLNRLVNISDSAFEGTQLSELDIGYNSLSVLPAFSGLGATLTKLYAGNNVLVDISGLSSLTALIELDLRQNRFVSISEIPKTTVQTLYMAGNVAFDFAGAYRELNQFETLETLFITYFSEHIRSVPDLANLTSLRVLDLRGNHLERIANLTLVNLPGTITELVLRECKLTSVPDLGEELAASLEILDLRVNDITDYGVEALSALTNLRALRLAYNPLVRWPDFSYVGTKNAHPKKLIMNGITTLPALYNTTFCHFHDIHLVGNMLTEYPDLTACRNKANTALSLLNLKQNNINESADTSVIGGIASLAKVILDNNPFRRLPNLVSSEFPGLAIYLRNNKLGSVAENLLSDRHFHSLHLSGNDFKEPPYGVIAHTTILDLSSNAIVIMDALRINLAICENVLLHSLDLSDNYLGDILDVPNLKESLCFRKTEKTIILEGVAAAPSCPCRLRWLAAVRRDCPHVTIQLDSATPCEDAADWAQFDALMAACDEPVLIMGVTDHQMASKLDESCASKVRISILQDEDFNSCYEIINAAEILTLNLTNVVNPPVPIGASTSGSISDPTTGSTNAIPVSFITLTTKNMDCRLKFHVSVNHPTLPCRPRPLCHLVHYEEPAASVTRCQFRCECPPESCSSAETVVVRVAHPLTGWLCEVSAVAV